MVERGHYIVLVISYFILHSEYTNINDRVSPSSKFMDIRASSELEYKIFEQAQVGIKPKKSFFAISKWNEIK